MCIDYLYNVHFWQRVSIFAKKTQKICLQSEIKYEKLRKKQITLINSVPHASKMTYIVSGGALNSTHSRATTVNAKNG